MKGTGMISGCSTPHLPDAYIPFHTKAINQLLIMSLKSSSRALILLASGLLVLSLGACQQPEPMVPLLETPIILNDDGGWCWFEDPRAVITDQILILGTVATGRFDTLRAGDIEATIYDLQTGTSQQIELFDQLQRDDHNSPVFLHRPDDRLLTLFARHGNDSLFYFRRSLPDNFAEWYSLQAFVPTEKTRLTYSNAYLLPAENNRIYNFFRGLDFAAGVDIAAQAIDRLQQRCPFGQPIFIDPLQLQHRFGVVGAERLVFGPR